MGIIVVTFPCTYNVHVHWHILLVLALRIHLLWFTYWANAPSTLLVAQRFAIESWHHTQLQKLNLWCTLFIPCLTSREKFMKLV